MRMHEHVDPEAASWIAALAAKFFPPALGALIVATVDPPKTRQETFWRLFVALGCSYLLGGAVFDFLKANFALFSFLDPGKRAHTFAVEALVGGVSWTGLVVLGNLLRRWRATPAVDVAREAKELVK